MVKCHKCNNSITNENAKFCDNCGEFLQLTGRQIRFNEKISNGKLMEFKKILIESRNSMADVYIDSGWYYGTIFSYLIDLTNIKQIFNHYGIDFIDIGSILVSLANCDDSLIAYEFLVKVNEFFESQKDSCINLASNVIIYTNLDERLKTNVEFKNILKFFDLEIFNFDDYVFNEDQKKYANDFNLNQGMFKFSKRTRDFDLIKSDALNEIYSLFGYLTYLNKFNDIIHRGHINELSLNNRVTDFECNALIITNEKYEILYPGHDIITASRRIDKSKIDKIVSPELIKDFNNSNKRKISNNIKHYFNLYYLAASESSLENSFLKFWSLSEKIIKDIYGDVKKDKLKKVMKNILKAHRYPKYITGRIDNLYIKRNYLVHENNHGEITHYDQSLIKVISERLIEFLINFLDDVDYLDDYAIILDYFNMEDNEKRRRIGLIQLTIDDSEDNH